jgi:hypothetical protein
MSMSRQLAVATRGFRGTFAEKFYVNEAISLDEGLVNIDIIETVPVATIEVISVEVSSLDVEGAF